MNTDMQIGDKIRDIEDGDAYFEGIIVNLIPLEYKITNIVWGGKVDTSMNGQIIQPRWWQLELIETYGGDK
jgi:hypothetical protein